jgi:hypothetical protein
VTDVVDEFEARVSAFPLTFTAGPRAAQARMPDMVKIYRDIAGHIDTPANPAAFCNRVANEAEHDDPRAWPRDQLVRRALITWASLIRQHHFLLVLRTRYTEDIQAAYWFPWLDHNGIDILAVYEPFAFGIALSLDTDNARFWAESVKAIRHPPLKGIKIARFEVDSQRNCPLRMANGAMLWLHPAEDAIIVASTMRALRIHTVDVAFLNAAEERTLVNDLKARGVLRHKYGYDADARPLLAEYRLAVRARSLGFGSRQADLFGEAPA